LDDLKQNSKYKVPIILFDIDKFTDDIGTICQTEGSGVYFKNIEPLRFGENEVNTFAASFQRMLKCLGQNVPYWYIMAISGAAFRLQIHYNSWRMVSADPISGFELTDNFLKAFGVSLEQIWTCGIKEKIKKANADIRKSMKQGKPVIGLGMDGRNFHGLVVGNTRNDKLLALDCSIPGIPHAVTEELVWCYHIVSEIKEPPNKVEQFRQAMKLALELAETKRFKSFHIGQDAYNYWYSLLTNPDHYNLYASDWQIREKNDGNHWIFINLCDARNSAAKFCESAAIDFPEFSEQLVFLSSIYKEMVLNLKPLLDRKVVRQAKNINAGRPWTNFERRKQAKCLMEVKELEQKTIPILREINLKLEI